MQCYCWRAPSLLVSDLKRSLAWDCHFWSSFTGPISMTKNPLSLPCQKELVGAVMNPSEVFCSVPGRSCFWQETAISISLFFQPKDREGFFPKVNRNDVHWTVFIRDEPQRALFCFDMFFQMAEFGQNVVFASPEKWSQKIFIEWS